MAAVVACASFLNVKMFKSSWDPLHGTCAARRKDVEALERDGELSSGRCSSEADGPGSESDSIKRVPKSALLSFFFLTSK